VIRLSSTLCALQTYCVDAQVADSACTATAYLTGVKTNYEMIGLNAKAKVHDCDAQMDEENLTESILRWAQKSCKSAGIVTNTRITHASPAGLKAIDLKFDLKSTANFNRNLRTRCIQRMGKRLRNGPRWMRHIKT
jgi:Alkaline phosphatase